MASARIQTDSGERFIGRVIHPSAVEAILENLGAESRYAGITARAVLDAVLNSGSIVRLANGWIIKRSRVSNENRAELTGYFSFAEKRSFNESPGLTTEIIQYSQRVFIQNSPEGESALTSIMKSAPVASIADADESAVRFQISNHSRIPTHDRPAGLSVAEAQAIVDDFRAHLNLGEGRLGFSVFETQQQAFGTEGAIEKVGRLKGAYLPKSGTVGLIASHLSSARDA